MKIHQLQKSKGFKDKARRRGRGNATGTGNYSGRGLKGQKSRSGYSMKPFFEGGQTSIVQRLPKARGFTRYYKLLKDVATINLGVLDADKRISDTMEITKKLLKDLGYIKSSTMFVKILSHGDYSKHLTFLDIDAFSASAKDKMEHPGTVHTNRQHTTKTSKSVDSSSVPSKKKKLTQQDILPSSHTTKKSVADVEKIKKPSLNTEQIVDKKPIKKILEEKPVKKPIVKKPVEKNASASKSLKKATTKKTSVAKTSVKKAITKKPAAKKTK